ncbi:MAG: DEAD/DEAH box helicase family protein, partial [Paludibacter sp.]
EPTIMFKVAGKDGNVWVESNIQVEGENVTITPLVENITDKKSYTYSKVVINSEWKERFIRVDTAKEDEYENAYYNSKKLESQPSPTQKEPWEMTAKEAWTIARKKAIKNYGSKERGEAYVKKYMLTLEEYKNGNHRNFVEQALSEGKQVPAEVLADYPELSGVVEVSETKPTNNKVSAAQAEVKQAVDSDVFELFENEGEWKVIFKDYKNKPIANVVYNYMDNKTKREYDKIREKSERYGTKQEAENNLAEINSFVEKNRELFDKAIQTIDDWTKPTTSEATQLVTASTELASAKAKYDKAQAKYLDLKNKLEKDPAFGMGGQTDIFGNVSGADNLFGNDGQKQAVEAVQAAKKAADDLKPEVDELQAKVDRLKEAVQDKVRGQQEVKFEEEKAPQQTFDTSTNADERLQAATEIIRGLEKTIKVGTTPAELHKSTNDFMNAYKGIVSNEDYLKAVRYLESGQRISAVRIGTQVLINVEHNEKSTDLIGTYMHETGHKAFDIVFINENFDNIVVDGVEDFIPDVYWQEDSRTKISEAVSHQIEELLNIYTPEQIKNGDVDVSLLDKRIIYPLTKTLNKLSNGKISIIGTWKVNDAGSVPGSSGGIQEDGHVENDIRPEIRPDNSDNGISERERKKRELAERLRNKLGGDKPQFKRKSIIDELIGDNVIIRTYGKAEKISIAEATDDNNIAAPDDLWKEAFEDRKVSNPILNADNIHYAIYDLGKMLKPLQSGKELLHFDRRNGVPSINIANAKQFYSGFEVLIDRYAEQLVRAKQLSTQEAQEVINETLLTVLEAKDYYRRYANGEDVWRTEPEPQFKRSLPKTINIDGVERPTTNSNGQPIHATEEGVRNFYKWFGDSVAINKKGQPVIFYHGTGRKFDEFEPMQASVDFPEAMYFSNSKKVAESYSNYGLTPYEVYLKIEKPFVFDAKNKDFNSLYDEISSSMHYAVRNDYDGMTLNNIKDDWAQKDTKQKSADTYVTFDPKQIKSATGNDGTFDPNNPNINFKRFDPELNAIAMELSEMIFEDGDVSFEDYSAQMLEYIGEPIRPLLKPYYEMARVTLEAPNMTSADEVHKYDITNFNHKQYVSNRSGRSQQDSPRTNEVPGNAEVIPSNGGTSGQVGTGKPKGDSRTIGRGRGKGDNDIQPSLFGEQSNIEVSEANKEQSVEKPTTGDTDGRGNGIDSTEGHTDINGGTDAAGNKTDTGVSETFKQRVARKLIEQQKAESIPVKSMDIDNIRETLPFLLSEQQDDVLKAETRFYGEQHQNEKAAYGKGMLFTNGTGTGKTYTGLGIAKRFAKQGKGNILIVVPSEAKVLDWAKDGKNLGLEISPLKDTKDAGQGAVVTTYANFRANEALKERDFDLIMYDESHRLMEEKTGKTSSTTNAHYAHSNVTEWQAFNRIQSVNPTYIQLREMGEAREWKGEPSQKEKTLQEKYNTEIKPVLQERAKKAYENTKVVFLSATPFKAHFNLRYANGSLFDWGNETTYASASRGMSRVDAESQFFLDNFGSAYEWKFHRLQTKQKSNAEAIAMQEVQFAENLIANGAMSGRAIESDKDYSREFPLVTLDNAETFNRALNEIYSDEFKALKEAANNVFHDYNYTTKLFESLKASMSIQRIQDHLDLGRKVVIFHRRKQADVLPPFRSVLEMARLEAQQTAYEVQNMEDGQKKDELVAKIDLIYQHINAFEAKYADLLAWEQTLDYSPAIDQLQRAFGEKVVFINGDTSKKDKPANINKFNDDNSEVKIIVVQEEAGKEGISLHDTTGKHQRVLMSLSLPISSTTTLQIEGRVYRIGQESNVPFEYPLLGIDQEISDFGQKINKKLSTTENLAMGNQARDLLRSFAEGVLFNSG